jgi:hypothetical protein
VYLKASTGGIVVRRRDIRPLWRWRIPHRDILETLCSQRRPRDCHREHRTLGLGVIEIFGRFQAFFSVEAVLLYPLRHMLSPRPKNDAKRKRRVEKFVPKVGQNLRALTVATGALRLIANTPRESRAGCSYSLECDFNQLAGRAQAKERLYSATN